MKQQINVIDLDKTLIPYDSFRLLLKKKVIDLNHYIIWLTIIRMLNFISSENYKRRTIEYLSVICSDEYFKNYANKIIKDVDKVVLDLIYNETEKDTINILLSASPNFYVKYIIEKLGFGWCGEGSHFDEKNNFIHLHGEGKIIWLSENFKSDKFIYNFAISDSCSDNDLLLLFKRNIKWTLR